jgi:hypothetical protein
MMKPLICPGCLQISSSCIGIVRDRVKRIFSKHYVCSRCGQRLDRAVVENQFPPVCIGLIGTGDRPPANVGYLKRLLQILQEKNETDQAPWQDFLAVSLVSPPETSPPLLTRLSCRTISKTEAHVDYISMLLHHYPDFADRMLTLISINQGIDIGADAVPPESASHLGLCNWLFFFPGSENPITGVRELVDWYCSARLIWDKGPWGRLKPGITLLVHADHTGLDANLCTPMFSTTGLFNMQSFSIQTIEAQDAVLGSMERAMG